MLEGGTVKMDAQSFDGKLLGLFELDGHGNVLYCSFEGIDGGMKREASFEGFNFFTSVVHFQNADDFKRRFDHFRLGGGRSDSFQFNCEYADGPHVVRVVMARLSANSIPTSFLVHLKKL